MKRVVVTGAAGFLGSHLCKHHLDAGDFVLGIDDSSSSPVDSSHLRALKRRHNFSFLPGDITSWFTLDQASSWATARRGLDVVYNFACPASPPVYQSKPIHTMMTCVAGTEHVLRLTERFNATMVHASTSEVYGDPSISPQPETYRGNVNSYGPRSCYDEGKRAAEALCFDYLRVNCTDARLVRIFNTYGPNMDPYDGRVVSNFIVQALKGEKLTIYGDGRQTRSFCYVDDLIRGIVALGELDQNPGTPINLGNPTEFTVKQLAQRVVYEIFAAGGGSPDLLDISDHIDIRVLPVDDPTQRRPDITLAKKLLSWEPRIDLGQGLIRTIAHFRERLTQ